MQCRVKDQLVPQANGGRCQVHFAQWIAFKAVCAGVVQYKIRRERLHGLVQFGLESAKVRRVVQGSGGFQGCLDGRLRFDIVGEDPGVVSTKEATTY